jgi:formyl-CoA transferase/CoA:oxalate CoA-transferase
VSGALEGLKILDLTRQMAGPYATTLLSDHGAEVVKIESTPNGDPSRWTGVDNNGGDSPLFLMWNRGKRSLALDVRSPGARGVLDALVDWADVLIENFRPGVTEKMGLGWDRVSARNPRLIYCSVTGFGPSGPLADRPATDPLVQAISGVMSVTGDPDRNPVLVGVPIADFTGAMQAVQGILLAVIARDRTGRGQRVDVSLFGGLLSALATRLANYWASGVEPTRHGGAHSVVVPYQVFASADGLVMAGTWGPGDWPKFCAAVDRADLVDDPRFASNEARLEHRDDLVSELAPEFAARTTDELSQRFLEASALFAPLLTIPQAVDHEQTRHLGLVGSLEHSRLGTMPAMRSPIDMSDTPPAMGLPAPVYGEHSLEVLDQLGFEPATIADLVSTGTVFDGRLGLEQQEGAR